MKGDERNMKGNERKLNENQSHKVAKVARVAKDLEGSQACQGSSGHGSTRFQDMVRVPGHGSTRFRDTVPGHGSTRFHAPDGCDPFGHDLAYLDTVKTRCHTVPTQLGHGFKDAASRERHVWTRFC